MIYLVAGGPVEPLPDLRKVAEADSAAFWVGVDIGTSRILEAGIVPHAAFGDFDSVTEKELFLFQRKMPNLHIFPSEKDETDLEIALKWVIAHFEEEVTILGATGGRLDHEWATVLLLTNYANQRKIKLLDRKNELMILMPGEHTFEVNSKKYISFLSLSESLKNVTQSGFKYNLVREEVFRASTLSISNEIIGQAGHISFEAGICLVVRSED